MSVTVYTFLPAWGSPDISPFCSKVLTFLRMAGIEHTVRVGNPLLAPRGKLPYIVDDGEKITDSSAIFAHLAARHGDPLDADLSPRERTIATTYQSLLEHHLYFIIVYNRWIDPAGWAGYRLVLAQYARKIGMRGPLVLAMLWHARRMSRRQLFFQGLGRQTPAEVATAAVRLLDAIEHQLGDGPFFLGERPRSIDATVFAFLAAILDPPMDNPTRRHAASRPALVDYVARMRARYLSA